LAATVIFSTRREIFLNDREHSFDARAYVSNVAVILFNDLVLIRIGRAFFSDIQSRNTTAENSGAMMQLLPLIPPKSGPVIGYIMGYAVRHKCLRDHHTYFAQRISNLAQLANTECLPI
jgi:hypothetical protein